MPPANSGGSDYGASRKADTQSPEISLRTSKSFALNFRPCMPEPVAWSSIKYQEKGWVENRIADLGASGADQ
jgi:hypothetical protein